MEIKKVVVAPGKEESISLKENKVIPNNTNKKKPKQIQLQKLDLGTNPINISSSNEFLNITYIFNFIKTRIKTVLIIIFVLVVFVLFFSLKGIIFNQNDEEIIDVNSLKIIGNNKLINNQTSSSASSNSSSSSSFSSSSSSNYQNISKASSSSNKQVRN